MFFRGNDCEASLGVQWGRELTSVGAGSFDITQVNSMISGDFYHDMEDTVRGLALDAFPDQPSEASSVGKAWHHSPASLDMDSALKVSRDQLEQGALGQTERSFQESDLPPQLPDGDGFALSEATAIYMTDEAAWRAGNRLLAFLNEEIQAHVKEVNRTEFTIKAEVLFQSQTCVVKVRAYRLKPSAQALTFVFEFQRQGGDSLAFSGFFREARHCLCPSSSNAVELSYEAPGLPPRVAMLHEDSDCSVTPLIDAACHAKDRSLQASAAAGLAEAAEDSPTQVCTDSGFVAIQRLMQAE